MVTLNRQKEHTKNRSIRDAEIIHIFFETILGGQECIREIAIFMSPFLREILHSIASTDHGNCIISHYRQEYDEIFLLIIGDFLPMLAKKQCPV